MADGPDLTLLRQRIREIERRMGNGAPPPLASDLGARVDQLEREVADIAAVLERIEPMIARIDAAVPAAATKAEVERLRAQLAAQLADKPGRATLWGVALLLLLAVAAGPAVMRLIA
jgi:polyhydroxyalkanoate synthesis regulator phasin